ncbi:unnamed protein product [Caenorhabditis auriculariae]|uniref:Uncharacterized protein n=1 Tax=Caenorhabditis auriculariae TaxID=2777116 RepID=A0A8S1GZS6_9PELO|nr:unnamed protein product [Caenorhabditis auriculariae]
MFSLRLCCGSNSHFLEGCIIETRRCLNYAIGPSLRRLLKFRRSHLVFFGLRHRLKLRHLHMVISWWATSSEASPRLGLKNGVEREDVACPLTCEATVIRSAQGGGAWAALLSVHSPLVVATFFCCYPPPQRPAST